MAPEAALAKPSDKDKNIVHMNMPRPNAAPIQMETPPPPFVPPPDIVIQTEAAPSVNTITTQSKVATPPPISSPAFRTNWADCSGERRSCMNATRRGAAAAGGFLVHGRRELVHRLLEGLDGAEYLDTVGIHEVRRQSGDITFDLATGLTDVPVQVYRAKGAGAGAIAGGAVAYEAVGAATNSSASTAHADAIVPKLRTGWLDVYGGAA